MEEALEVAFYFGTSAATLHGPGIRPWRGLSGAGLAVCRGGAESTAQVL